MPFVLEENGVAVHIYDDKTSTIAHAYDGDMDSRIEVEIDLDSGLVAGYGPTNKLPTEEHLWKALQVVKKHREELRTAWDEING